jgi:hypothetical protein
MKLAITPTQFAFGLRATPLPAGWEMTWLRDDPPCTRTVVIDEAFLRARCGPRELADCTSLYVEIDLASGLISRVHNRYATTLLTKNNGREYALKNSTLIAAQIYIPFADSPVTDWVIRANANPDFGIDIPGNTEDVANTSEAFLAFAKRMHPSINTLGVTSIDEAAGVFEVEAQLGLNDQPCRREGVRLFANSESGYLNKREAFTDPEGIARFRARRLDLAAEDIMQVELGFKFSRNVCRVDIPHR